MIEKYKFNKQGMDMNIFSKMKNEINSLEFSFKKSIHFDELPKELVLEIFSYLAPDDLCRISRTDKNWQKLSNEKQLWQVFAEKLKETEVNSEDVKSKVINFVYELKKKLYAKQEEIEVDIMVIKNLNSQSRKFDNWGMEEEEDFEIDYIISQLNDDVYDLTCYHKLLIPFGISYLECFKELPDISLSLDLFPLTDGYYRDKILGSIEEYKKIAKK